MTSQAKTTGISLAVSLLVCGLCLSVFLWMQSRKPRPSGSSVPDKSYRDARRNFAIGVQQGGRKQNDTSVYYTKGNLDEILVFEDAKYADAEYVKKAIQAAHLPTVMQPMCQFGFVELDLMSSNTSAAARIPVECLQSSGAGIDSAPAPTSKPYYVYKDIYTHSVGYKYGYACDNGDPIYLGQSEATVQKILITQPESITTQDSANGSITFWHYSCSLVGGSNGANGTHTTLIFMNHQLESVNVTH